jgi:hypothetical protein
MHASIFKRMVGLVDPFRSLILLVLEQLTTGFSKSCLSKYNARIFVLFWKKKKDMRRNSQESTGKLAFVLRETFKTYF